MTVSKYVYDPSYRSSATIILQPMGWTSEMVAETYKVSRQKQDEYALISHSRAAKVNVK